jgi:hypothetical protein
MEAPVGAHFVAGIPTSILWVILGLSMEML